MNKIEALKQYKLDGLLDHIEIFITDDIYIKSTSKTLLFFDKNNVMLTDVYIHSLDGDRCYFNRWILLVEDIKSIEL